MTLIFNSAKEWMMLPASESSHELAIDWWRQFERNMIQKKWMNIQIN